MTERRWKKSWISEILKTPQKTLHELVDYLREDTKDKDEEISRITRIDHPLVGKLKALLNVPYNFFIDAETDLQALLNARGFQKGAEPGVWTGGLNKKNDKLTISMDLFENGKLKYIRHSEWKDEYVKLESIPETTDELPF